MSFSCYDPLPPPLSPPPQSSGGLSDTDIDRMVREAEQYAEKDKERKALIDAKNDADNTMYSVERSLNEHKDKLPQVWQRCMVTRRVASLPAIAAPSNVSADEKGMSGMRDK